MKVNNIHNSSQTILLDLLGVTYYNVIDSLIVRVFNMKTCKIEEEKVISFSRGWWGGFFKGVGKYSSHYDNHCKLGVMLVLEHYS